jgi:hypothetical protein
MTEPTTAAVWKSRYRQVGRDVDSLDHYATCLLHELRSVIAERDRYRDVVDAAKAYADDEDCQVEGLFERLSASLAALTEPEEK